VSSLFGEHPLASRFNELTPEEVFNSVESLGQTCSGRFIILNSFENRVYQLELESGDSIIGKFYRPGRWTLESIEEEHDFIFELRDEELPVCAPLELPDGYTVGTLTGSADGIHYALFPKVRGRSLNEPNDEQLRGLGRLIGRMHQVGRWESLEHRPELSPGSYGRDNLNLLLTQGLLPPSIEQAYADRVERIVEISETRFEGVPVQRIHGDCHLGNILWRDEGALFLDFDDMLTGPAIQDLWMLAPDPDEEGIRKRDILLSGYGEVQEFDVDWLGLVEPLRALRIIHYATWIARRWHDPIFKRTYPDYGSADWWWKEVEALDEQIQRIQTGHAEDLD
jgi:Ser/Thr protein kinase RdoA (MazF antagonist)